MDFLSIYKLHSPKHRFLKLTPRTTKPYKNLKNTLKSYHPTIEKHFLLGHGKLKLMIASPHEVTNRPRIFSFPIKKRFFQKVLKSFEKKCEKVGITFFETLKMLNMGTWKIYKENVPKTRYKLKFGDGKLKSLDGKLKFWDVKLKYSEVNIGW